MNGVHLVRHVVEDVRHVAEVSGGENGVQKLPLAFVLISTGREHAGAEKQKEVAAEMIPSLSFRRPSMKQGRA